MLHFLGLILLGPNLYMEAIAINKKGPFFEKGVTKILLKSFFQSFWNQNIMREQSSENSTCLLSRSKPKSLTKILLLYKF